MTTIATDGKVVCSDSRSTSGNEIIDEVVVKVREDGGDVFAITGAHGVFGAAIKWFKSGADPKSFPREGKADACLLVMGRHCITRYSTDMPYGETFPYPQAFGSGSQYAMGALLAGASPWAAIEIASKLDVYTGGPIHQINLAQAWELHKEAAE